MKALILAVTFLLPIAAQTPSPQPAPAKPKPTRVVPPARIMSFGAQNTSLQAGGSTILAWETENPNAVTIEPGLGRVAPRGSRQVSPSATTKYTLTVTGPNDTTLTREVTITVAGAATPSTAASSPRTPARLPDGKPDLSGVYGFAGLRGATPPAVKPGAEKFRIVRGPNDVRGNTTLGPDCKPLGVPQSFVTPYPIQFVHTPKLLVMIFEYPNAVRIIPTDGRPHSVDPDPTWMGESVARWDGDTLVVDSVGFNEKTEVSGFMHSEQLHVVERYLRQADGSLQYDVTVEDPNVWVTPWVMPTRTLPFRPDLEKVEEFVCETNTDYSKLFAK